MGLGNIFSIILIILLSILLLISSFLFYDIYSSKEEVRFNIITEKEDLNSPIFNDTITDEYPEGMLFYPTMRFKYKQISYYIDGSCPETRSNDARMAFSILSDETVLDFYELDDEGEIWVSCSEDISYSDETHYIAGEGGPTSIINTSNRIIILNGTILLYEDSACSKPVVAIHEILHVIGFKHSSNKNSIMYEISNCNQKITLDIINTIRDLYKDETLPDLTFRNVSAVKHGRYLDMDFMVTNQGIEKSNKTEVIVFEGDKELTNYEIKELEIGQGLIVSFKNVRISYSTNEIRLVIDYQNEISELNKENNIVVLSLTE